MTQYPLLPCERTTAVLDELAGIAISPSSPYNTVARAGACVQAPVAAWEAAPLALPIKQVCAAAGCTSGMYAPSQA